MTVDSASPVTTTPTTHGGFLPLPLPPRLLVPLLDVDPQNARNGRIIRGEPVAQGGRIIPVAPATGAITSVQTIYDTTGRRGPAVEIDVDSDQPDVSPQPPTITKQKLPGLIDRLAATGVWADRKTTPNLAAQLESALNRPIDMVVCNLLEADGAPLNAGLLVSGAADVVAGAAGVAQALGVRLHMVGSPDVLALVRADLRRSTDVNTRLVELANDYPQADPTILIYMLTGRRLRPDHLPVEQGVLMIDGAAALAIGRAITENQPMTDVPLAIRERGRGRVHLVTAAVGTPISFVLEQLSIPARDITVRIGPVLRDVRVDVDTIIAGGELRLDVGPLATPTNPEPCIRCGWCVGACPTRIHPAGLLEAAQQHDREMAHHFGLDGCIECGICSYVCPARLPLLGAIRSLKVMEQR